MKSRNTGLTVPRKRHRTWLEKSPGCNLGGTSGDGWVKGHQDPPELLD